MAEKISRNSANHSKDREDRNSPSSQATQAGQNQNASPSDRTKPRATTTTDPSVAGIGESDCSQFVDRRREGAQTSVSKASVESSRRKEEGVRKQTHPGCEVIPDPQQILVSSAHSEKKTRHPGHAVRLTSKPGDRSDVSSETQVTVSPPQSPSPDGPVVKRKHNFSTSSNYNLLPNQTNPHGGGAGGPPASKGLATSGAMGLNSKRSHLSPLAISSPPSSPKSHHSLPASPTGSTGNFSSGENFSSAEHLGVAGSDNTQCRSLNTAPAMHFVASDGHRSFDMDRGDLKAVKPTHRYMSDRERSRSRTPPPQACEDENDNDQTCRNKVLLPDKSLKLSSEGQVMLRSISESSGLPAPTGSPLHRLQLANTELEAKLKQKDLEIEKLSGLLATQIPDSDDKGDNRGHGDGTAREGGRGEESVYNQQRYIDNLHKDVERLTKEAKEVESLKRKLKHAEGLNDQAKGFERQLVEQVKLISVKDAEITNLKETIRGLECGGDVNIREQLSKKDLEISRLRACLTKKEKLSSMGGSGSGDREHLQAPRADGQSPQSVALLQAEFDRKLQNKEKLIFQLKKRVNELTELKVASGDTPTEEDDAAIKKKLTERKAVGVGVASGGVVSEPHYGAGETVDSSVVQALQGMIKEKDEKLKKMTDRLQHFEKVAGDVVKMQKHTKEQSEVIVQLRRELIEAGAEDQSADLLEQVESLKKTKENQEAIIKLKRQEMEQLRAKGAEADTTIRKLMMQNNQLKQENKKLLDDSEKEKIEEQLQLLINSLKSRLSQQSAEMEKKAKTLNRAIEEKEHFEQKVISQMAVIQNLEKELCGVQGRASELSSTLEQQKIEAHHLQKQKQELVSEVEAHKLTAQVYREDFETERKDRETAHAQLVELEERYKNETADLKQKLQRVSADCGRLTQQMQSERTAFQQQLEEANKNVEDLKADNQVLQGEILSKTQQVKQYKKQVDQFRTELDHCHQEMEAFKQQAEHHKQQIEIVVHQREESEQVTRVCREENERLKKQINTLMAREHLQQHAAHGQGKLISVEEFMKERRKVEDLERLMRDYRSKLENLMTEKAMVVSENEHLKKCLSPSSTSSSSRSPPPSTTAGGSRPPGYPGRGGQGGPVLPNQMRPLASQHQHQQSRLGQQKKSTSVDSADFLSSRGHADPYQFHKSVPDVSIPGSNPTPVSTRPEARMHDRLHGQQQLASNYQGHRGRRSHTSSLASTQRDLAITNANPEGYPYSADGRSGAMLTNAEVGGGARDYPIGSPPTNAKFTPPPASSSSTTATSTGGSVPRLPPHSQSSTSNRYPSTSSASQQQRYIEQRAIPSRSQPGMATSTYSPNNIPQSSANSRSNREPPPFTGHGRGGGEGRGIPVINVGQAHTTVAGAHNQPIHIYQNIPLDHQLHGQQAQQQQQQQHHLLNPAMDESQGSGPLSLPSYASGGLQLVQMAGQGALSQGYPQQSSNYHGSSQDDLFLHQMQQKGSAAVHGQPSHLSERYHSTIDEVEKDSSPPNSMMPPAHQGGAPLSLNPQSMSQGLAAPPPQPRHRQHSHQMPISPPHSKAPAGIVGFGGANRQLVHSHMIQSDPSVPPYSAGNQPRPMPSAQQHRQGSHLPAAAQQQQQRQQQVTMGGPGALQVHNQRPASSYVKSPVQESSEESTKLPPSLQKQHAATVYVPPREQYKGLTNIPEPDSDVCSNVSAESGLSSPVGGSQVNLNENTLEKGIDVDIRRAARNIKKQSAGRESPAGMKGVGGVEAPFDPNLVCPTCRLGFRIGEIQKFKRHAATCTGTKY